MGLQAPRFCHRCKQERAWRKDRVPGASRSVRRCVVCGGPTQRVKRRRKVSVLPGPLYDYRRQVEEADDCWRRWIYFKAVREECAVFTVGMRCSTPHPGSFQAMHLFPKGHYPHIRHDPDNGAPGCAGCHLRLTRNPDEHAEFRLRFLGAATYERLRLRAMSRGKTDVGLSIIMLRQMLLEAKCK